MVALEVLNSDVGASTLESQKSLDLVVAVIYAAISDACYSRKLLSKEYFYDLWIQGDVSPCKVVRLDLGHDAPELVRDLQAWHGAIKAAVSSGYVQRVTFGFTSDISIKTVLEEYLFDVQYMTSCNRTPYAADIPHANSIRSQTSEILRSTGFLLETMDDAPTDGPLYVFMKMYHSMSSPPNFKPNGFASAGPTRVSYFNTIPFQMKLGMLNTNHHRLTMGICSVLDSIDVQPDHIHQTGDDLSMPTSHATSTDRNQNITLSKSHPLAGVARKARPGDPKLVSSDAAPNHLYGRTPDSVRKRMDRASKQFLPQSKRMKSSASLESSETPRRARRGGRLAGMQKLLQ